MDTFIRVNRSLVIVSCGYCPVYKNIASGVTQLSHLDPLLFFNYANDFTKSLNRVIRVR